MNVLKCRAGNGYRTIAVAIAELLQLGVGFGGELEGGGFG
jgi:hypothetical protein